MEILITRFLVDSTDLHEQEQAKPNRTSLQAEAGEICSKNVRLPHSNYNLMLWVSRLSGAINKVPVEVRAAVRVPVADSSRRLGYIN